MVSTVGIMMSSTPATVPAADAWRDAEIARLGELVDQLAGPPQCRGSAQLHRTRLLNEVRREANRRHRNMRARIGREIARTTTMPDVDLRGGKFVVGPLKRIPSRACLDFLADE